MASLIYYIVCYVLNINLEMWEKYLSLLHVFIFAVFLIQILSTVLGCGEKARDRQGDSFSFGRRMVSKYNYVC